MTDLYDPFDGGGIDDEPENLGRHGPYQYWQHHKPVVLPSKPASEVRAKLEADMQAIIYSEQSGAWLFRHPPGVGKTYRFCAEAKEYAGPVVGCAPTVAEAEKMSEATGLPMLRAQGASNCAQYAWEQHQPENHRKLKRHVEAGHAASSFCHRCKHIDRCKATPGQYRSDQAAFARDCATGTVRAVTTVKMLEFASHQLLKSPRRVVIWTDEDMLPHVLVEESRPLYRQHLLEWIRHAEGCGMSDAAVDIVREVADLMSTLAPRHSDCADTIEDHATTDGREWAIHADLLTGIRAKIDEYETECGRIHAAHPSEYTGEDKEELDVGHWRPALFARLAALLRGACWCHVDKSDQRSLRGLFLNRHLLDLGKMHAVLQSDATASPAIWSGLWGDSWRGCLDDFPQRNAFVKWYPASVKRSDDKAKAAAFHRATVAKRMYGGTVGILTFMGWADALAGYLRSKKFTVRMLNGSDHRTGTDFVIGYFGKHDRGINDFHEAGLSCFYILGSFRVPMHAWHRQAGAILAMGGKVPDATTATREAFPVGHDGLVIDMAKHKAMTSGDRRTNWIAGYERGAQLSQAIERVRSVDRANLAATGKHNGHPIPVLLWGPEACKLTFPISIEYEAPA